MRIQCRTRNGHRNQDYSFPFPLGTNESAPHSLIVPFKSKIVPFLATIMLQYNPPNFVSPVRKRINRMVLLWSSRNGGLRCILIKRRSELGRIYKVYKVFKNLLFSRFEKPFRATMVPFHHFSARI